MATYTERVEYKIEILPNKVIQLRAATIVERDGEEVGRQYHRSVFTPGSDISEAPEEVTAIVGVLWTPQVISSYQASIEPEPTLEPTPSPTPDPTNLIPDNWTQEQRIAAMAEVLQEFQANR